MEKSVQKVSGEFDVTGEMLPSSDISVGSELKKIKSFESQKELNSWDCSSPTESDVLSKPLLNDWDSSSDIHETLVEAFDMNESQNEDDDWDSEKDKIKQKTQQSPELTADRLNFFLFSNEKCNVGSEGDPPLSSSLKDEGSRHGDLFVEDFEEKGDSEEANARCEKSSCSASVFGSGATSEESGSEKLEDAECKSKIFNEEEFSNYTVIVNQAVVKKNAEALVEETSEPEPKSQPESQTNPEPELELPTEPEPEPEPNQTEPGTTTNKQEINHEQSEFSGVSPIISASTLRMTEERSQKKDSSSLKMKKSEKADSDSETTMKPEMSESWLLFDEEGQYQEISKNEVSMMFNGRSAEAVLEGRAKHLMPTCTPIDTNSLKNLLSNLEPNKSQLCISKENDVGGDDEFKKLIDLERKVENTLFYIRPETDFRASIRIIPINAEMIHLWKRNRDGSTSNVSFETDILSLPQDSAETSVVKLNRNSSLLSRPCDELRNETEDKNESTSDQAVQQSDCSTSKTQTSQNADFSKLLMETRIIVDTLTSNFRNLQARLDGETSRNMALQGELSKLRHLVKSNQESNSDQENLNPGESLLALKASDKLDARSKNAVEETEDKDARREGAGASENNMDTRSKGSVGATESKMSARSKGSVGATESKQDGRNQGSAETTESKLDGRNQESAEATESKMDTRSQESAGANECKLDGRNQVSADATESKIDATSKESAGATESKIDATSKESAGATESKMDATSKKSVRATESKLDERSKNSLVKMEAPNAIVVYDKGTTVEGLQIEKVEEIPDKDIAQVITVNIYTTEDIEPIIPFPENRIESYTTVQSNLRKIERKMKRLEQENLVITRQNVELKRKLKEISVELEKYLSNTSYHDLGEDEGRELDALKDQVATLQRELNNLKTTARDEEEALAEENFLVREEFAKTLSSLNDWCVMANEVFEKVQTAKYKLEEVGVIFDVNLGPGSTQNPKQFSKFVSTYLEEISKCLHSVKNENFLYEQALKDVQKEPTEISGLDQVISGYSELIEECRKGQITGETKNKVMEDYFAVIMEKASLMEELKILKTENEMLLQSQMEHYEKLKQTMIALKDRKSEITALESSQKLFEDEKTRMGEVLKLCEEEKKQLKMELLEKDKTVEDLVGEIKRKDLEIQNCNEKLVAAAGEINSFEKSCRFKDELINKLKNENEELLSGDRTKQNQIEVLKDEIKNLEKHRDHLEAELNSTKLFVNDSQKEMTDYITHLEALVSSSQESLEKTKQKLKESNQTINRLKNEGEVLEKQHQCDVKLFNNAKDELEICKERLAKTNNKLKELEEEHEKLLKKYEIVAESEKQKSETLETLSKEFKEVAEENSDLREKVKIYSQDKEELLSEQKELISKYGLLSKEIQKLQEKYRTVKTECNERTELIRYMEMMLRENLVEYNNRIACLEQNISQIIEKIVAYKNNIKGKGVDPEVKELRHQLNVTCQERKELENVVDNYYSLMKHMENEIKEREKKVDELNVRLSLEQQKSVEYENERSFRGLEESKSAENLKIEQLESQIAVAENELGECKRELQKCQTNHENEKKKLELTIADLQSEVKRYQLRMEVMMRNLSNCNKSMNGLIMDKRNEDDSDVQTMKKEIQEKDKKISELNDAINKHKAEIKLKDGELENFRKKMFYQNEEFKNLQNQMAKLQDVNKITESQQKEREEMAEKLFQSIKLIMEERSARQTIESLALEKEKNFKTQIDQVKDELVLKTKECETLTRTLEEKKKLVTKLQDDLKKMKMEIATLKGQVSSYKKRNEEALHTSSSLTQLKTQHISQQRLDSCLKELKEIRDLNLELRKTEGQYQAKIVRLEDEIRDARLLIKELQGDIKTEKKSKKAFKNMILAAKMELEKCVMGKQLMSVVAERISRHLDLSEIPSRELLSGFRLSDSSSSLK